VVVWRSNGGSPLAASALLVAVGVMLYAWWALRDLGAPAGWQVRTGLLWCVPLLFSAVLFSRDVYSYAAQGLMLATGLDPYHQGVRNLSSPWVDSVSRVWLDSPAPYGPLFLVASRGAAQVANGHLLVAVGLLRLMATAGLVVLGWAVPAVATRLGTAPGRAVWLGFLCPMFALQFVAGAHNDALMVGGMTAAVALALDRRHLWAALVIAATMAVKAPAAVVMPFLALLAAADWSAARPPSSRARLVLRSLLVGAATVAVFCVISLATGLGFSWVAALDTPGQTIEWTSLPTGLGMGVGAVGTLFGHNVEHGAVAVFRAAALVVLAVALVTLWVRALRRADDRRFVVLSAALALGAMVVLSPAFHPWYLLWVLPLLSVTVVDRRWHTALGVTATVMAVSVLPGGFSLALVTAWVGVPLCFVAVGLLAWLPFRRRRAPSPAGSRRGG
jgi:alpha-1,6-mannosyltransferase